MKIRTECLLLVVTALLVSSGCAQEEHVATEGPAEITPPIDLAQTSALRGEVLFTGQVPAPTELRIGGNPECSVFHKDPIYAEDLVVRNGKLQNVLVYVKEGLEGYAFPVPTTPVTLDQKGCLFLPHVVGMQVGQPIQLTNSDPTLHNIHARATASREWNIGLPFQGMARTKTFPAPEIGIALKCDLHPWMKAYVHALPHPYFAVTGADGAFVLEQLPPGEYVIEAWHEQLGAQTRKIALAAQDEKTLTFTFSAQ